MMKKILIGGIVAIIIVLVLIGGKKENNQSGEMMQASVRLSWIPSASFAGDIVGLTKFDEKHNLNLTAEFGGPGINTSLMVQSGQNTFGYLGADEVLAANDKGADFVIIGLITDNSPAGYVSLKENNITTPKDLEGKKIGVLPYGNTTMIYENMLKKNNVDRSKISEVTISGDMKSFLSGSYDVHPVFVYDETIELDLNNVDYNLIKPEDFGVDIKGTVYFTKRETLENNPELVEAFVKTVADGMNYAIKNPEEAVQMMKDYSPELDVERENLVMKKAIPYFTAYKNQPLNSDIASWTTMVDELKEAKIIKNDVDLNKVLQFQFINEYYK